MRSEGIGTTPRLVLWPQSYPIRKGANTPFGGFFARRKETVLPKKKVLLGKILHFS
jgi:hypothetical protein